MQPGHNPEHPIRRGRFLAHTALSLSTVTAALGTSIPNVALPAMSREFSLPVGAVQWVTLAFLLSSTVSVVLVGKLSDLFGRSRVLWAGMIIFVLSSTLAFIAPSLTWVIAARALQGVGAAAMIALPLAIAREINRPERLGRAMGALGSSMAAGMALGPAVGGVLSGSLGWQSVFAVLGVLALIALVIAMVSLRSQHQRLAEPPASFDFLGASLLVLALGTFAVALTLAPGGVPGMALLLLAALASAALFVLVELRSPHPIVDIRLLQRVSLFPSALLAFLAAFIMMTFTVVPPFYLTQGLSLTDASMGLVLAIGPLLAIIAGVPAGYLGDWWGTARAMTLGLVLMVTASVSFVTLPALIGLGGFIVASLLLTPGNQLFMASNNSAAMSSVGDQQQGVAAGVLNLARNLGFIVGTSASAAVLEFSGRSQDHVAASTLGLQLGFGMAAAAGVTAVLIALALRRQRRKSQHGAAPGHLASPAVESPHSQTH